MSVVACGGQKRALALQELKLQVIVSCSMWVFRESNLDPLQEKPLFLIAEPSPWFLGTWWTDTKWKVPWVPGAGLLTGNYWPHRASLYRGFMTVLVSYRDSEDKHHGAQSDLVPPSAGIIRLPYSF